MKVNPFLGVALVALLSCSNDKASGVPTKTSTSDEDPMQYLAEQGKKYWNGAVSIDLDRDGRAEWSLSERMSGHRPAYETVDLDGDGNFEIIWDRVAGASTLVVDADENGIPERHEMVTRLADDSLQRVFEMDTNADGKTDRQVTNLLTESGTSMHVSEFMDVDEDGTLDIIGDSDALMPIPYTLQTIGQNACYPMADWRARIDKALDDVRGKAAFCLNSLDPTLGWRMHRLLAIANIRIYCGTNDPKACGETTPMGCDLVEEDASCNINIALSRDTSCPLAETLFHELLHHITFSVEKEKHIKGTDLLDQTTGCTSYCFRNTQSGFNCRRCLMSSINAATACPEGSCYQCRCPDGTWNPVGSWFENSNACFDSCAHLSISCLGAYKDCAENHCQ
jgi:hypothetical protein